MLNLSCNARSCTHNNGGMCNASTIKVEGISSSSSPDTYCSTYEDKTYNNGFNDDSNNNLNNNFNGINSSVGMNYVGQITAGFKSIYDEISSPNIECNAQNCIYNCNNMCESRHVNIQGDGGAEILGTRCGTFTD